MVEYCEFSLREDNYLPFMTFYYRKSLFKIVFGQNISIVNQIFKIFAAHFRTNRAPKICKEDSLPTIK